MTLKTLLAVAALSLAPALASAQCGHSEKQAMTCASGSVYDAETGSCKVVSS